MKFNVSLLVFPFLILAGACTTLGGGPAEGGSLQDKALPVIQKGHSMMVNGLGMSPDGSYYATAGRDGTLLLWRAADGMLLHRFSNDRNAFHDAVFLPDNRTLVASDLGRGLQIFNITSRKRLKEIQLPGSDGYGFMYELTMSPDGTSLLTAVYDNEHEDEGHIFIYTTSSWTRVKILSYPSIPRAAEYSPDTEAFFVGLESGLLMAYDPAKNKEKWTADLNSPILSLAVSPDSRTLAAGFADGRLLFLDTATGNLLDEKKIGTIKINSLVWAPGKGCLFAGGRDSSEKEDREDQPGYLFALDAATLDTLWSNRSLKYLVSDMVWNPQTDSIAVSMGHVWSGAFSVFTGDGDRAWRTRGNSKRITDLSYIPATDELLVVGETGYIPETEIISTIDFIPELPSWGHGAWASLSPDGDFVYAGMPDLNPSYLMERKSGKILAEYPENNLWVKPPPVFSPEGTYLVLSSFFDNPGRNSDWLLSLRNLERERLVMNLAFQDREIYDYALSPDGRTLAVATGSNYENRGEIIVYDAATGKETLSREFDVRVLSLDYSPDGESLAIGLDYLEEESEGTLRILSASTLKTLSRSAGTVGTRVVSYSPDGLWIASGTSMGDVIVWKPSHPVENINVHLHTAAVSDCVWSPDGGLLFTGAGDGNVCIYNFRTGDYATLVMAGPEWIMFTPDGYFDASRNGGSLVALVKDDAAYGIDQFALALNRPDIILERLESSAQEVIDHYRSQYRKRMRRLGLSAEEGNVNLTVPVAVIRDYSVTGDTLELNLAFSDEAAELKTYNIWVNDVPVFGMRGKELTGHNAAFTDQVTLNPGESKVEISCLNSLGNESFRPVCFVKADGEIRGKLYYLGFGVSDYRDDSLDLGYAAKDVLDLEDQVQRMGTDHFDGVKTRVFTDEEVTRGAIEGAAVFLADTEEQDTVILAIAGHGMHDTDEDASYYFLTGNTDLDNIAGTAAPFELIEDLLQGIGARKKLFLMDTCESGIIDEEDKTRAVSLSLSGGSMPRGLNVTLKKTASETPAPVRTFLQNRDRFIYNDLSRRSGAIVFSSSRGGEYSYESDDIANGYFTESILRALSGCADTDGDGWIDSDELRDYVAGDVSKKTRGLQNPTVDRDNLYQKVMIPVVKPE